jgi:hypothetical protein
MKVSTGRESGIAGSSAATGQDGQDDRHVAGVPCPSLSNVT